jgi:UDP-N-acetylenolpyruvoylglucosamine reductase
LSNVLSAYSKQQQIEEIAKYIPHERILRNEPMAAHTTFRVGGCADVFVEIDAIAELEKLCLVLGDNFYLIGNGSNVLVSDSGIRGIVLHLSKAFSAISAEGECLVCEAGASLAAVAKAAYENGLSGFEFASGIPGSLGGAVVMNAGAYDGEIRQVIEWVKLMTPDGKIVQKSNEEMHFSYRHSILKEERLIVLAAAIRLKSSDPAQIKVKMEDLAQRRREKQPLEYPSAGSTFKRPEGYFAAKLIQDAGLSGFSIGGACVSSKHCGFVINTGNATANDIYLLIKEVQKRVMEYAGVRLEPEVLFLGDFGSER